MFMLLLNSVQTEDEHKLDWEINLWIDYTTDCLTECDSVNIGEHTARVVQTFPSHHHDSCHATSSSLFCSLFTCVLTFSLPLVCVCLCVC